MRRMALILVAAIAVASLNLLPVATAVAQQKNDAPNASELAKDVKTLLKVFDVDEPKPAQTAQAQPAPQKNIADVADRALTMVEGVTARLSETLKQIAPDVWRIMLKQQYAKALTMPIWSVVVIFVAFFFSVVSSRVWHFWDNDKEGKELGWWVTKAIPTVVGVFAGFKLAWDLSKALPLVINPEFYAIQDLLKTLLARSI